jgi:hypothetical protein
MLCDPAYKKMPSANIQCAGKGRGNLKTALLGKIHGCVYIALFTGQLHALNILDQLAVFQALIFREIFFLTVFAWRRNHGDSFPWVLYNCLKMFQNKQCPTTMTLTIDGGEAEVNEAPDSF